MKAFDDFRHPGLIYPARVAPEKIGLLGMLVEGHEGLALVRTKDPALGTVEFWVSPSMRGDFEAFLEALRVELGVYAQPPQVADLSLLDRPEA